ncbi:MAG TPA: DNA polymerase/3'-5' exonuclease PolX [Longimicrobiales bacterium]|nr:DNA polymerase/3'-5' exonuclease PolX [Longimicrobiales bacterium]
MDRHAVALVLNDIGTLLDLNGADPFRSRAFFSAARAVEWVEGDLADLVRSGELLRVRGIGAATARVVQELVETGVSSMHQELRDRTPDGMIELLAVPGLGARRIYLLHEALGVDGLDALEHAAAAGRVADVPGFGERTQEKIREGVAFVRASIGRRRLPDALTVAQFLVGFLEGVPGVERLKLSGELRRRLETVGGVDVLVATTTADDVLDAFLDLPGLVRAERRGRDAAEARYSDGIELRVRCVPAEAFAAAWVLGTGSEAHAGALRARAAERGLRLAEDGLWRGSARLEAADEVEVYRALELAFVPPELREGRGEVEAAARGELPDLVDYGDLRGCFHCHTTYSDGKATLREMAGAARERGWRYLGIADHSQAAAYAGGLTPERIRAQHREIDQWNAERGGDLWLFKGIEADILPDGRLDYEDLGDAVLGSFDYVVGSVHSSFGQPEAEMTARVRRALGNPHLTFLGHPTGRLLLSRDSFRIDVPAILAAAAERGVAIEINANPRRLELDWRHWPAARRLGIRTAINPDAHTTAGLGDVEFGIGVARKGWLTAADVVNAWDVDEVKAFFGSRRTR